MKQISDNPFKNITHRELCLIGAKYMRNHGTYPFHKATYVLLQYIVIIFSFILKKVLPSKKRSLLINMSRDRVYIKYINSSRWRQLRLSKIKSNPLCEICSDNNIITPAVEVHHITPVESANTELGMRALMFNPNNLMSLCHECHAEVHRQMFSHSKTNTKKANERRTKRFIDKYL